MQQPSNQMSAIYVCIDAYGAGRMEGRLYSQCLYEPLPFFDVNSFFLNMEHVMEYPCYPQAFQRKRAFGEDDPITTPYTPDGAGLNADKRGDVATGTVRVTSRQNTSWQGFITWDDDYRERFDSDLELLSIIHSRCGK